MLQASKLARFVSRIFFACTWLVLPAVALGQSPATQSATPSPDRLVVHQPPESMQVDSSALSREFHESLGVEPSAVLGSCDPCTGAGPDCNGNGISDICDLLCGVSSDCDNNDIPDECEYGDCNFNEILDICEIAAGTSSDCNQNDIPDQCELIDCNNNGVLDVCDIASGASLDCNGNEIPDFCEINWKGRGTPIPSINLPDGLEATVFATGLNLNRPFSIAVSEGGDFGNFLYVMQRSPAGDPSPDRMVRIDPFGFVTEFAVVPNGSDMVFGPVGGFGAGLYVLQGGSVLNHIDAQGTVTRLTSEFSGANGLTFGFDDDLFTARFPGGVDRFDVAGTVTNFVATDVMLGVTDIERSPSASYGRNLFVTDSSARLVWQLDATGSVTPFASEEWSPAALAFGNGDPFESNLFVTSVQFETKIFTVAPDGTASVFATGFSSRLFGIAFGRGGAFRRDMYLPEIDQDRIVRIGRIGVPDCNHNSVPDECDLAQGILVDCNQNGVADLCEPENDCDGNGVADICDIADGTSKDCNGNGTPDSCDIAQNVETDCNANLIPDNCDLAMSTSTDCNTNGTLDSCEIAELVVADCNGNGLPDECEGLVPRPPSPETPPTPKNRFLSFTPANPTLVTAIRVTFTQLPSPYDQFNDRIMWVGMPRMISEAPGSVDPSPGSSSFAASTLQCEPLFRNWSDTDLLHVYHEFIVPGGTYDFQVITDACDVALGSSYSAALALSTSSWGDVVGDFEPSVGRWSAPDGKVAVPSDIVASLDGFANKVGAPHKTRVDLEPGVVDLTINITDVTFALDAFSGQAYPFQPQSSPCP